LLVLVDAELASEQKVFLLDEVSGRSQEVESFPETRKEKRKIFGAKFGSK